VGLTQQRGHEAEREARLYLEQQGLIFVAANWRVHFHKQVGEIDLIMRDRQELVFVEVRARTQSAFGGAAASINAMKQLKLRRSALAYLQQQGQSQAYCRFDVMAREGRQWHWYRNAF
jgi:putative endonuclease